MTHERLKILMIAPTPFFADRGCHVRIYEEARALMNLGHDVRIVTYHLGRDMPGIAALRTPFFPWYRKLSAGPSWHKPYIDIFLFFRALAAGRRFHPHIIHAHLHEGAFIGLLLKKLLRAQLVFDCQGSLTAEMIDHGFIRSNSPLFCLFRRLEERVNNGADFIITSSAAGRAELMASMGNGAERVAGLPDGVDCGVFRPYPREEARRVLKLPSNGPVVVFLGVLNSYQGVDILLQAAQILRERGTAPHFLIMGFPEEEYRRKAASLGLAEIITFTGRVDYDKAPFYLCAGDIAVSPKISLTEANGKLYNYMACGLPTVVFESPANREILGESGIYARHGDSGDLAARIHGLLCDPARMAGLSQDVRNRAVRDCTWAARGEQLVGIYRKVINCSCQ
ncbi:MAG TPA: glycosyltransferase family 4 protein [Geobacteraceae bacterium]